VGELEDMRYRLVEKRATQGVPKGRAMAQVVSHRSLTAEARVHAKVSPCWICVGKSGTGTGYYPSSSGFAFHIIPP
jgi:hypothetical protein